MRYRLAQQWWKGNETARGTFEPGKTTGIVILNNKSMPVRLHGCFWLRSRRKHKLGLSLSKDFLTSELQTARE
ncbi:hypothetical protein AV530_015330 [Patagioenas fasciata monilis]|uniref:Uncharacterized protein n=1 Tax=Patagioenas fasciata monilis TaxID=372326 RepID=A0A1V4K3E3_PATFA|nr:hypothetical protein AV530_015330 [Patagioenas fasciata monilis]